MKRSRSTILPGFGITMGCTLMYLSVIVLVPLSTLVLNNLTNSGSSLIVALTDPRVLASYRLTFGTAAIGAAINAVFGFVVAWTLVRYRFPGQRVLDALIDLPFAMPTAVSGIALTAIYAPTGLIGSRLAQWGIQTAFSPLGIVIAMTFIGLPFVVRTLQPALLELDAEAEEASASLGASRWQTFRRVIFPSVLPALVTGFALAFARALGEYGSVVFISGNMPFRTEITSLLIISKLEQYDYAGATAIALVMMVASFVILFAINLIQWWLGRRQRSESH